MKNNKGFTLIEIIITLGIVLLITGVAVGSFVGISKQKKTEEWALVKGQIETSAEQYFSSNKYMFENLPNSGITGYVTVGELVSNNYLNKVVNPIDNELVNACSKVEITYNNGKVIGTYRDYDETKDSGKCNFSTGTVVVSSNGAPEITLEKTCTEEGNDGWCKGDEDLTINFQKGEKTVISKEIKIDNETHPLDGNTYTDSLSSKEEKEVIVTVKNAKGTSVAKTSYKLDNMPPECNGITAKSGTNDYSLSEPTWTFEKVVVNKQCSDDHSGCGDDETDDITYENNTDEDGEKINLSVSDKAGNIGLCPVGYVKIDTEKPTAPSILKEAGECNTSNEPWQCSTSVKLKATHTCENVSGCYLYKKATGLEYSPTANGKYNNGDTNTYDYSEVVSGKTTKYAKVISGAGLESDEVSKEVQINKTTTTTRTTTTSARTFTVTFYKNGATKIGGKTNNSITRSCTTTGNANSCKIKTPTISREDWSIVGWGKSEGAKSASFGTNKTISINSNKTYYAITRRTYQATFNVNTAEKIGYNSDSCKVYNKANSCVVTAPSITAKKYYTVIGWNTNYRANSSQHAPKKNFYISKSDTYYAITKINIARSCSASKLAGHDSDCTSSAGNAISAQVLIKCNGKIDYVSLKYYYPNARYSVCNGNTAGRAVCKHYPGGSTNCSNTQTASSNINGAVFNLRGCGVTTVKYKYKVVANGKTIHSYGNSWSSFSFSSSNGKKKLCNPERGSYWFN